MGYDATFLKLLKWDEQESLGEIYRIVDENSEDNWF